MVWETLRGLGALAKCLAIYYKGQLLRIPVCFLVHQAPFLKDLL